MTEIQSLTDRYPQLVCCEREIREAVKVFCECAREGGKIVCAGNGGSASDCEHIVGELQKEFKIQHQRNREFDRKFYELFPNDSALLASLTPAVAAVSLASGVAINTALINDVGASVVFAQKTYALCRSGDVFFGISTSGNSESVVSAMKVAKVLGCKTVSLTGSGGGTMKELSDIAICVPETKTYKVQELHLPVYHCICAAVESELFGSAK